MAPTAALLGINFISGELIKQVFILDTHVKDPILACEQSQVRCEKELSEYTWTIVFNHEALELHKNLLEQRVKTVDIPKKKIILPAPNIPSLSKKKKKTS